LLPKDGENGIGRVARLKLGDKGMREEVRGCERKALMNVEI
jgi:hypothetical protein